MKIPRSFLQECFCVPLSNEQGVLFMEVWTIIFERVTLIGGKDWFEESLKAISAKSNIQCSDWKHLFLLVFAVECLLYLKHLSSDSFEVPTESEARAQVLSISSAKKQ